MATYIGRGVNKPTTSEDEVIRLTAELDDIKKANAELTAQIEALSTEKETLTVEKETLTTANEELNTANAELTAQIEKLTKKDKTDK